MLVFHAQAGLSGPPGQPLAAIRRAGTPGEAVWFGFAVVPDRDLDGLAVVPPAGVDLWLVHEREQPGLGLERGPAVRVPELLLKDDGPSLADGYGLWCGHAAHLPRRLLRPRRLFYRPPRLRLSGDVRMSLRRGQARRLVGRALLGGAALRGEISVRHGPDALASLPVEVESLPFALVEPRQERFLWYRGTLDCADPRHAVPERIFREQLATIRAAGFTSVSLGERRGASLSRAAALVHEAGFRGDVVLQPPLPRRFERVDLAGLSPLLYVCDEPDVDPARRLPVLRANVALARSLGIRTMASVVDGAFAGILEDAGVDRVDVYFPRSRGACAPAAYYWQAHLEKPAVHRALAGLALWTSGAHGISPYCFQHRSVPPSSPYDDAAPWDPAHPLMRPHLATYPARDGTVPTLQWAGLAEGIGDLRWLTTVEALAARAKAHASPAARQLAEEVRARLAATAARVDLGTLDVLSSRASEPWPDLDASGLSEVRDGLVRDARALHEVLHDG